MLSGWRKRGYFSLNRGPSLFVLTGALLLGSASGALAAPPDDVDFDRDIEPILSEFCFGCHAFGEAEGSMSLEELLATDDREEANHQWHRVLRQLQAGLMPPADEDQPDAEAVEKIEHWIKYQAFGIDPQNPDPGHVTVRRLNQVEYRNTVRDLIGVDYDTDANFPADDTGHGFDNIGEVLSISPLLLEKYVNAAEEIVSSVVPNTAGVVRQQIVLGEQFHRDVQSVAESLSEERADEGPTALAPGAIELSYYIPARAEAKVNIEYPGDYLLRLHIKAAETYVDGQFDTNKCEFTVLIDDEVLFQKEFVRQNNVDLTFEFNRSLDAGTISLAAVMKPLSEEQQIRDLRIQLKSVEFVGPDDEQYFIKPEGYERFFPGEVPKTADGRRQYAEDLLRAFATKAYRRPVDDATVERLVALAESIYGDGRDTFESGIAKSMTAIMASPRFLFREEAVAEDTDGTYPLVDEYSLASRLSYFLWSSMPDEELARLASEGKLRDNLDQQITRMMNSERSRAFSENFVGQWLRARAIESIQINSQAVIGREPRNVDPDADVRRKRFFELFRKADRRTEAEEEEFEYEREVFRRSFGGASPYELTDDLRKAMRRETEMLFEHVLRNDLSLLDLIDSNYTFLNEDLWVHYQMEGIDRIQGDEMRLVRLPKNSLRGGVLTQGTFLAVTSNPDRTSPVKRGLFILENLLGTPPPAPPPNIPGLEDVESDSEKPLTLRETLAIHRANVLCASCHNRMDPLGLAFENFNALGRFRTEELGQSVEAAGTFGEQYEFSTVKDLKRILVTHYQDDLYRCITEKMLTYALGRAVEYSDAHTVDELMSQVKSNDGRASSLIHGIIHSAAFQRMRNPNVRLATQ